MAPLPNCSVVFFHHLEKTAGTTLRSVLQRHAQLGLFDFFSKRARSLGAWRLPPPVAGLADGPPTRRVQRLRQPTREQFETFVQRHEPVVVSGFAPTNALAEWSWDCLIRDAHAAAADIAAHAAAHGHHVRQ